MYFVRKSRLSGGPLTRSRREDLAPVGARWKLGAIVTPKGFGIKLSHDWNNQSRPGFPRIGYSVTRPDGTRDPNISQNVYTMAFRLVEQFDPSRIILGLFCTKSWTRDIRAAN